MPKDKQMSRLAPLTNSQAVTGRAERCLFIKDHGDKKSHRSFVILVALVILFGTCKKTIF